MFKRWGLRPRIPVPPAAGGYASRPPIAPQSRISGYAPATLCTVYNCMRVRSFCFEQFFLARSVVNLMMLTKDVCLIVFCLKSLICITHCVTLIPSCYIALSYLFAKIMIANKFLMTLLNPPPPPLKNPAYATGKESSEQSRFL